MTDHTRIADLSPFHRGGWLPPKSAAESPVPLVSSHEIIIARNPDPSAVAAAAILADKLVRHSISAGLANAGVPRGTITGTLAMVPPPGQPPQQMAADPGDPWFRPEWTEHVRVLVDGVERYGITKVDGPGGWAEGYEIPPRPTPTGPATVRFEGEVVVQRRDAMRLRLPEGEPPQQLAFIPENSWFRLEWVGCVRVLVNGIERRDIIVADGPGRWAEGLNETGRVVRYEGDVVLVRREPA